MLKKGLIVLLMLGMTVAVTNAFAAETCGTLLARCGQCHDKERICENLGRSQKYWKGTIKYMISNGAEISTDEGAIMVPCLNAKSEDALNFCK